MELIARGPDAREQPCLEELPLNLQQLPLDTLRLILSNLSFREKIRVIACLILVDCNVYS